MKKKKKKKEDKKMMLMMLTVRLQRCSFIADLIAAPEQLATGCNKVLDGRTLTTDLLTRATN
ncbi:hypothetical protein T4D_15546 [Trichinella pseudospiralis]|uniref:Uncharacterized protein n=1 Tax=Trichinella pseudospiralis TaxID=6337 RepID=A0A0V1FL96_TRIPS|nr:hypothetical protein T4D_15546 [Trichinella pseudospiralis]